VKLHIVLAAAVAATFALPLAAQAQGIPDGVAHGGYVGMNTAGPIGAVVGGVVGGIEGLFGIGPVYAAYDEGPVRVDHRRHWVRHSYRHVHHKPATG